MADGVGDPSAGGGHDDHFQHDGTREGLQPPPDSAPGIERLERDVLSQDGHHRRHPVHGDERYPARRPCGAGDERYLAGHSTRQGARARLKIVGATIIPRHNAAASGTNTGWNEAKSAIRRDVNEWIRTRAPLDGVIDFDKAVRDPGNGDLIFPPFNCDGIHPTPRVLRDGLVAAAQAVYPISMSGRGPGPLSTPEHIAHAAAVIGLAVYSNART